MNDVVTKLEIQPLAQAPAPASQIVSTDPMAMVSDALAPMPFSTLDLIAGWGAALICTGWFCWEIFNWLFPRRRDDARSDGDAR